MTCPVCGHSEVNTVHERRAFKALYGPPVEASIRVDTCPNCTESGDFECENDRAIEGALDLSALRSVPDMAQKLEAKGYIRPYIERVTGLPIGSIAKCEAGEYDAAVIVALRLVYTLPPILGLLDSARNA